MSARFYFHAPDGRIYGPADFPTLTRWHAEKKLDDDSRLKQELTETFLTYRELAANPPLVETIVPAPPPAAPLAESEIEPTATPSDDDDGPVFTLAELVRRGLDLYRRGFPLLWLVAAVIQTPLFVLQYLCPQQYDAATHLPTWPNHRIMLLIFGSMLLAALFSELGSGLLTNLIRQIEEDEPLSFGSAARNLKGRIFPLCKTWILRVLIIASWGFLAALLYGVLSSLALPLALRKVILMVLIFPAVLLFLRYLISTQVVILEKLDGLQALRRSGDLVRFSNAGGGFVSGDLRLLMLALIPWIGIGFFTTLVSMAASALPAKAIPLFESVLSFVGAATATPLLIILFVLFVIDSRRRLRQSGYDQS